MRALLDLCSSAPSPLSCPLFSFLLALPEHWDAYVSAWLLPHCTCLFPLSHPIHFCLPPCLLLSPVPLLQSLENSDGFTRHNFNAIVSDYALQHTYFPAFKTSVIDGKAKGVMCSCECSTHSSPPSPPSPSPPPPSPLSPL